MQTKESIVTMIKAASSRAILLIFSSFLPARAVGVVGDAATLNAFIDDVAVAFVLGRYDSISECGKFVIVCAYLLVGTPRQR